MHLLQPKHTKLKPEEVKSLTNDFNISISQLPKIKLTDPSIPEGCQRGDVIKIQRPADGEARLYYRVVS